MMNGNAAEEKEPFRPMDAEQLRKYGHKMVDFIADYYKSIEQFPVLSQVQPGYLKDHLPNAAPDQPEEFQDVLDDITKKIIPGVTHWQSPNFFGYFSASGSIAGFLGEMLCSGLNTIGFNWITFPASTELEITVLDWLAKLLNLPEKFLSSGHGGGIIQGTASEALVIVLLAARDKILGRIGRNSMDKLVVYSSDQVHSFLKKSCQIVGIHSRNFRVLQTDASSSYGIDPRNLDQAIHDDMEAGLIPFFLCATVGTTSSAAVDPLVEIGQIAEEYGMWFHVDAAYAGNACICPEYRHYLDGVEYADSFGMNPYKWLLTNFNGSCLWVKDQRDLVNSLGTNPEYLANKISRENKFVDFKDMEIPLGRRFRSLKLWMVFRLYGAENLKEHIRNHIKLARQFEELVRSDNRFEIVCPTLFSLVCFRLLPRNEDDGGYELNSELLDAVNSTGKLFFTHTIISGKYIFRFSIGATLTEERHIRESWKVIQNQATIISRKFTLQSKN
ncbi:putative Tyrosine decarboxylase (or alternatively Aromatic aldehyde synthase) [Zostera marina]|uniref:Putative Tyrosine decarboxylase (Or alternatively Aromatic aldehyde synthase) n=1 Tax=Zostera marina TaxID=29655 RepID=A0A0K9PYB6_ZOSMR|nr:putative Tyrosine decarboxylase (or alternatively Aromatic aldehyde synthase) [Zostera marina]